MKRKKKVKVIDTLEMTRNIRDAHYELLKNKSNEEQLAFFKDKAQSLHAEISEISKNKIISF